MTFLMAFKTFIQNGEMQQRCNSLALNRLCKRVWSIHSLAITAYTLQGQLTLGEGRGTPRTVCQLKETSTYSESIMC